MYAIDVMEEVDGTPFDMRTGYAGPRVVCDCHIN
jgi:hypothetical protein